jgi:hypothetical protein
VNLLAYPNFLPFEMLIRMGQFLEHGHRPKIVILGLTWRNLARDSNLRAQVAEAFRDETLQMTAKVGVLVGSVLSAIFGMIILGTAAVPSKE